MNRAITIALLASSACAPARTLPPEATEPVRIGLIVPLQGELGSDGESWRDSVVLAVREVNAAGGVLPGRRVELWIEDSESTVMGGIAAAEALREAGVVAIIGDAASSSTIAILEGPLATQSPPILLASGLSTSPRLTEINRALTPTDETMPPDWWFFRTVPPDDGQYVALANAMYDDGCRRVAIMYIDNDYGRPFASGVAAQYQRRAIVSGVGRLVPSSAGVAFPEEGTGATYQPMVNTVAAAMPDCVALIAYPQSAAYIVNDWYALPEPPRVQWFGTDGIRQMGFADLVGDPRRIDGFLGTSPITEQSTGAYNAYRDLFLAYFGSQPAAFGSNLYDATAMVLLAIAMAGDPDDREAIRDHVLALNETPGGMIVGPGALADGLRRIRAGQAINYEGASGSCDLDRVGNVPPVYELWRFDAATMRFVGQGTVQ